MALRFFFICKEAGTFQYYIYAMRSPWNLCGVFLRIYGDLFAIYNNGIVCVLNILAKTPLGGIILEQVSQYIWLCKIIDRYYFNALHIIELAKSEAADT